MSKGIQIYLSLEDALDLHGVAEDLVQVSPQRGTFALIAALDRVLERRGYVPARTSPLTKERS